MEVNKKNNNRKKCRQKKKASDKFNLQGLEPVHADRPILVLLV